MDGPRAAGCRGDRGPSSRADGVHPLHSAGARRGDAGQLAEILPPLGRADPCRHRPDLLDLVPTLARLAPPATVIDKHVYSPFVERGLLRLLRERRAEALVITGAETDVCVLAAVLGAVDFGYRVILATDALCSSSDATHDALLTLYRERFAQQIEAADTATILSSWNI